MRGDASGAGPARGRRAVRGDPVRTACADRGPDRAARGSASASAAAALLSAVGCLTAVLSPAPAHAQSGPGEPDPLEEAPGFAVQEEAETGWAGNVDLGFTLTQGNSETTNLSAGTRVAYRLERHRWRLDGSFVRATSEGEETADQGTAELMYDYFPGPRFFFFAKNEVGFDRPAGRDLRLAPGAGAGYLLVSTDRVELSTQAGVEWTRDLFVDGTTRTAARASVAESFTWQVADDTDVSQSLQYRPDLGAPGDFLLAGEVALSTMITEALGLQVTFRDRFDSDPFVDPDTGEAREKNDVTLVTGITFRF